MKTRIRTGAVLALLAAATMPARADVVTPTSSRIAEVTVFRDRAEIVRVARVELPAGASTVELPGIPFGVEPDSLRVSADGVPATLGAVEVREHAEEPQDTAELVAARDELRRLEGEVAKLDQAKRVDSELRDFLTSIRATVGAHESKKLGEGSADPQAIDGLYTVLQERLAQLAAGELDRAERQRRLQEQLALARAKLQALRPAAGIHSRSATVEVETRARGALELRLAYVVPGASWRPSYRAALDAGTGQVTLVAEGVVRQMTGEDWSGVELHLSTASPARGVEPPLLDSWYLRPYDPNQPQPLSKSEADGDGLQRRAYQNVMAAAPGVAGEAAVDEPADIAQATVTQSAYNVSFTVPGRSEVPADGRDHRVVLRSESLSGRIVHRSVPSLAASAYLTAVTTSPADYPLLAGPVRVFTGGAYLGSFPLAEQGPGVELTLPFGIDNRIEVVRVPLPRTAGRGGIAGGRREIDYAFRTKIKSLLDRPVTLVVEDRVPVAEDERIQVELGKETTDGWEPSPRRSGVMLWTLELKPREERQIDLVYTVRYPKDLFVPGLP